MKIYEYPSTAAEKKIEAIVNRGLQFSQKDENRVRRILEDVRKNGDTALMRYVNEFDAPSLKLEDLQVSPAEFAEADQSVSRKFRRALNRAVAQIESFHRQQRPRSWIQTERPGTFLGQMVHAVEAAGVYAPGGRGGSTPLVSSVLMGAIPAKIAGVDTVVMITPPTADGKVNPHLLAAAKKVGVDAVFKAGSAWGIAGLAYGTGTLPKVDVIVGPGNLYVTLAKKLVAGTVGIDMIAGPSEVLVIADGAANAEYTAADLLSQAEHDVLASAVLLTDHRQTAADVALAVDRQLESLPRREIAAESLRRYGAILVMPSLDAAVTLANRIAPEHLELHVAEPFELMSAIRNAGAVFMGDFTPEPVGDYIAGPNHVLPTAGTARFSSALSVDHFVKKTSLIHYSRDAFQREAPDIVTLAEIEGLSAHGNAVRLRMKNRKRKRRKAKG